MNVRESVAIALQALRAPRDAEAIARHAAHVDVAVAERSAVATLRRAVRSLRRVPVRNVQDGYMQVNDLPVEREALRWE